jgi:hypothetical protein
MFPTAHRRGPVRRRAGGRRARLSSAYLSGTGPTGIEGAAGGTLAWGRVPPVSAVWPGAVVMIGFVLSLKIDGRQRGYGKVHHTDEGCGGAARQKANGG